MGFEILPWIEGDNERFEIFEITQDKKWTPRCFQASLDNSPPQGGPDVDRTTEEIDEDDIYMAGLTVANINLVDDTDTVDPIIIPVNVVENIAGNQDLDRDQDDDDDSSLPDLVDQKTWDDADDNSIVLEQDDDDDTLPDLIYRGE